MNRTARRKPLNDAFKDSQPLPELPQSTQPAKPAAGTTKPSCNVEKPWPSIRRSLIRSLVFDAAFGLLIAVCLLLPGSRAGTNAHPEGPPPTAAWANPWHKNHHPWNAFPTHHLPAPPTDHSISI
ncbi:MAG TPA: hypothetical protein VKV04_16445 [Verrucomicrobiae bacterium]|nr:hypothetical protein [Verrucomicrobiae bacterium]